MKPPAITLCCEVWCSFKRHTQTLQRHLGIEHMYGKAQFAGDTPEYTLWQSITVTWLHGWVSFCICHKEHALTATCVLQLQHQVHIKQLCCVGGGGAQSQVHTWCPCMSSCRRYALIRFSEEDDSFAVNFLCLSSISIKTHKLVLHFWQFTLKWSGWMSDHYCSLKSLQSGNGGSSADLYVANPKSPMPSHYAIIILFQSVPVDQLLW